MLSAKRASLHNNRLCVSQLHLSRCITVKCIVQHRLPLILPKDPPPLHWSAPMPMFWACLYLVCAGPLRDRHVSQQRGTGCVLLSTAISPLQSVFSRRQIANRTQYGASTCIHHCRQRHQHRQIFRAVKGP